MCLLPANTTDLLQPMDISVNKPAKSFIREQFCVWYSEQLLAQFQDQSDVPLDDVALNPIDLSLANMKNIGAKWLVETAKYISDNPQFIVNGFARAGICRALDGQTSDDELDELLYEMDSRSEVSTTTDGHEEVEYTDNVESTSQCTHDQLDNPVIVLSSSSDEEV